MNCDDLNKGCIYERVVLFTRHRIIVELGNPYTKAISEQKRPHEVLEFLQETQGFEQTKSHQPHTFATHTDKRLARWKRWNWCQNSTGKSCIWITKFPPPRTPYSTTSQRLRLHTFYSNIETWFSQKTSLRTISQRTDPPSAPITPKEIILPSNKH